MFRLFVIFIAIYFANYFWVFVFYFVFSIAGLTRNKKQKFFYEKTEKMVEIFYLWVSMAWDWGDKCGVGETCSKNPPVQES